MIDNASEFIAPPSVESPAQIIIQETLNTIPDPVIRFDPKDYQLVLTNSAFAQLTNLDPDTPLPNLQELIDPKDFEEIRFLIGLLEAGQSTEVSFDMTAAVGDKIHLFSWEAFMLADSPQPLIQARGIDKTWDMVDPITMLFTSSFYKTYIKTISPEKLRSPLTLFMMDLDNLKPTNDTYGHYIGDQLLRIHAIIIKNCLRQGDLLFRYGGDEIVALAGTDAAGADSIAKRIKLFNLALHHPEVLTEEHDIQKLQQIINDIKAAGIDLDNFPTQNISISIGCSTINPHDSQTVGQHFAKADSHMYKEKHSKKPAAEKEKSPPQQHQRRPSRPIRLQMWKDHHSAVVN